MPKAHWAGEPVYVAAERFVEESLRTDGSLFAPGRPVWAASPIEDFYTRFVVNADSGSGNFMEKLEPQLSGAPDETVQLAAEAFFFNYLCEDDTGASHKSSIVNRVLAWMAEPASVPEGLADAYSGGLARIGLAKTQKWQQISFLVRFMRAWKGLPPKRRDELLDDPAAFREFVHGVPKHSASVQVEGLLHLVFPERFEPVVSPNVKRLIVKALGEYLTGGEANVDEQLSSIREALSEEYGEGFNFYDDEVAPRWQLADGGNGSKPRPSDGDLAASIPRPGKALADELLVTEPWLNEIVDLLNEKRQVVFYGPPGTGKTFVAQALAQHVRETGGEYDLVQFHPAYSYEDFFEGYRPRLGGAGAIEFELRPGPLRRLADAARANPTKPYLLIIDEINRGNIAKIFGELYFLLEYRERFIRLQYSAEDEFSLPDNLFVIGTMNTADRSIALVDSALRRRFYFVGFLPTEDPLRSVLRRWLDRHSYGGAAAEYLEALNDALARTAGSDEELAIGPSYFITRGGPPDLDRIWRHAIAPLLEERFFGARRPAEIERDFSPAALRAGHELL